MVLVILYDEYRITANGLLFALPALGLAGISIGFLRVQHLATVQLDQESSRSDTWKTAITMTIPISLVITGCWAASVEDTLFAVGTAGDTNPLLLGISCLSVAVVVVILDFRTVPQSREDNSKDLPATADTAITFVGFTAFSCLASIPPPFSSPVQITAFFGCLVLGLGDTQAITTCYSVPRFLSFGKHKISQRIAIGSAAAAGLSSTPVEDPSVDQFGSTGIERRSSHSDGEQRPSNSETLQISSQASPAPQPRLRRGDDFYNPWKSSALGYVRTVLLLTIWTIYVWSNLQAGSGIPSKDMQPTLDRAYHPVGDLDVVVSMHKESSVSINTIVSKLKALPNVSGRSIRLFIYAKDNDLDMESLKQETGALNVTKRPNYGREGESYLFHIIEHWDDLAAHTIFVQAHVHNSWEIYRRISQYLLPETGMLSLGFVGHVCSCWNCADQWGWKDDSGIVGKIYGEVYNTTCETVLLSYKGQFVASAQRIRGVKRSVYEELHELLIDPESWAHQQPYLMGRPDSMNAPFFGYTLERLWSVILQCSDLDVARLCPSLVSGTRRGGNARDCQCLDS